MEEVDPRMGRVRSWWQETTESTADLQRTHVSATTVQFSRECLKYNENRNIIMSRKITDESER